MEGKLSIPTAKRDHISGALSAPLEIVEYGDYQCPYCGMAYPIIKQIQKALGEKLRLVFRNFPLSDMHENALNAARAAEAAAKQGKFWEMHDMLYENQQQLYPASLDRYAAKLGLDMLQFKKDMIDLDIENRISSDFESGIRSGVNGTPTFFINGQRYDGNWEFEPFLSYLKSI